MKFLAFLLGMFLVVGCSLPIAKQHRSVSGFDNGRRVDTSLWSIEIERAGEVEFYGLAAIRNLHTTVDYVLLDATGVTLLEVETTENNGVKEAKGILKDSILVGLLSDAFTRIFLLKPQSLPCGKNGLLSFCVEKKPYNNSKEVRFGNLLIWRVVQHGEENEKDKKADKKVSDASGVNASYEYNHPWLGLIIRLKENRIEGVR